jgi:hypothetical protein
MPKRRVILSLEQYGESGWEWETPNGRYRTNSQGEGCWSYVKADAYWKNADGTTEPVYEWKQSTGHCQFALPNDRKRAYTKLYRIYKETIQ